ncbi:MAG: metalloenzyme [Armatimonadota bacterium]|nr:metalloenzyme [Armatimonadota bacterium]
MHLLLIFVDGLGLGEEEHTINPVVRAHTPHLDLLLGGKRLVGANGIVQSDLATLIPTDATLGVPGIPQSATGQTTLLTGLNAPQLVGRHVQAYPTRALQEILSSHNLFLRLMKRGLDVALANAYSEDYFRLVEERRLREGAITLAARFSGTRLRNVEDLVSGKALFHDLTNELLQQRGIQVDLRTPEEAGRVLASLGRAHHFTLFEFFLPDLVAHGRMNLDPADVISRLDLFLGTVVEESDLSDTLIVLTSDHGNIEDDRTPSHTRNPVPTLVIGEKREEVTRKISDLTHIAPAIIEWFG